MFVLFSHLFYFLVSFFLISNCGLSYVILFVNYFCFIWEPFILFRFNFNFNLDNNKKLKNSIIFKNFANFLIIFYK